MRDPAFLDTGVAGVLRLQRLAEEFEEPESRYGSLLKLFDDLACLVERCMVVPLGDMGGCMGEQDECAL